MKRKTLLKTMLILALALVTCFSAIGAATVYQTITAELRPDISVKLNENTLAMKDANGNEVVPIMIDGTTYLPVRAISNAAGLNVDWDEATQTVSLKNGQPQQNAGTVDVRGIVKNLVNGKDGITMLVDGTGEENINYDQATVTVNRDTVVTREDSDAAITYSDIKEGDRVEVMFNGPVAESYPVMGVAATLKILAPAEKIGVRGTVKTIESGKDGILMFVEGKLEADTQFDSANVAVNRETAVTREGIQTFAPLDFTEIKVGDRVEVTFKGGVSKSIPVLGVASSVKILKE